MALTVQQTFDKVADHLMTQMEQSTSTVTVDSGFFTTDCAYRGENGKMCAVGCLIPDDLYDPRMENHTSSHVLSAYPKFQGLFENVDEVGIVLSGLQSLHDEDTPDMWLDGLYIIATRYNLSKEVLNKYESV